jgi:hypothetical protein
MNRASPLVLAAWLLSSSACQPAPEPIKVEGNMVHVENQTSREWTDVEIWVNNHYRATRAKMLPGERLQVPLDVFVAGFGQRFDVRRQAVRGIEVTAKQGGDPIALTWGEGRRKY